MSTLEHALATVIVRTLGNTTGADLGPVCTDSRQVRQGSVFVALKGERFAGHDYAAQAARDGASVVVVERDTGASCPQIIVRDTQEALGALARAWRSQFAVPVICVAGSNGKTTTTQMIATILRSFVGESRVVATEKNYNNHIGVPMMLLRFDRETKVAVIEAGISHPGEMAKLVSWIRPTVTVITNAQREHQEFLDGVEKSKKVNDVAIAEGRCAVLQGSVADMMFTDNWFDAVTAFETVYFWPDLPRCFREVYRVLKVGGTFLICNEANGDTDKDERWTEIIGGMTIYKDTELKAYLEQAGFHEVQIHKKKGWLCVSAQK